MRINLPLKPIAVCCTLALVQSIACADVIIPTNGISTLNSGFESLACTNLSVGGRLNLNTGSLVLARNAQITAGGVVNGDSGLLEVNGSWSNAGTFNAGSSTVKFARGCASDTVQVSGATSFANLTIDSQNGALHIVLPPNTVQTVSGALRLTGAPKDIYIEGGHCSGIRLLEQATATGQDANVHLAPGVWIGKTPPAGCPGGAPDPEISRPTPVPAINGPGLGLLTALLAGVCGGSLRRRRQRPN